MLKAIADLLNQYANLLLAIITAVYAYFTWRMSHIMAKQILPNIEIMHVAVRTPFLIHGFDRLVDISDPRHLAFGNVLSFHMDLLARNEGPGNGSITKPSLVLRFIGKGYESEILPITTEDGVRNNDRATIDLGATIYLPGGNMQRVQLEYTLLVDSKLLGRIKEAGISRVEYYAKFEDNFGKIHKDLIKDVQPT